jgi:hypothetical protein
VDNDDAHGHEHVLAAMSAAAETTALPGAAEPCDRTWHEAFLDCVGTAEFYVLACCDVCGRRLLKVCLRCRDTLADWSPGSARLTGPRLTGTYQPGQELDS